jgi:hypothetical protein
LLAERDVRDGGGDQRRGTFLDQRDQLVCREYVGQDGRDRERGVDSVDPAAGVVLRDMGSPFLRVSRAGAAPTTRSERAPSHPLYGHLRGASSSLSGLV